MMSRPSPSPTARSPNCPVSGNAALDHGNGTISFADADLTDRPQVTTQFASFTYQNAAGQNVSASLTPQQQADIAALEASLKLTPASTNTHDGSVDWSFDVADSKLDFLAAGDVLTLTYMATVSDGHGGSASRPITVTIAGTNDLPTIVGETDPVVQHVVVVGSGTPSILAQGNNINAVGLAHRDVRRPCNPARCRTTAPGMAASSVPRSMPPSPESGKAGIVNGSLARHHRRAVRRAAARRRRHHQLSQHRRPRHRDHHLRHAAQHLRPVLGLGRFASTPSTSTTEPSWWRRSAARTSARCLPTAICIPSPRTAMSSSSASPPFDKVVLGSGSSNAFEIDNISAGTVSTPELRGAADRNHDHGQRCGYRRHADCLGQWQRQHRI